MYQVGDIRHLARLARPRIGVVTAVLPVHLERLGTIERIQQAKQELVEELPANGVAVLNGDDPRVARWRRPRARESCATVSRTDADVRAEAHPEPRAARRRVRPAARGRAPPRAPAAARRAQRARGAGGDGGRARGRPHADARRPRRCTSCRRRCGCWSSTGINGSRIVDDSYNASPESVLAALNLLLELPGQRKIAVLGDMLELGGEEETGISASAFAPRPWSTCWSCSAALEDHRRRGAQRGAARRSGLRGELARGDRRAAAQRLRPGDDVLVKGSLAMGMSAVVRGIRAKAKAERAAATVTN